MPPSVPPSGPGPVRLLRALWETIVVRFPRLPIVILRLVERLHLLFASQHPEPCEVLSAVYALGWVVCLAANPALLESSPYLRQIGDHASRPFLLWTFALLGLYWTVSVLLGGPPSGFIDGPDAARQTRLWLHVRMTGLTLGIVVWGALAALVSLAGLSPGTFMWGSQAVYCAGVQLVMGWRLAIDREIAAMTGPPVSAPSPPPPARSYPRVKHETHTWTSRRWRRCSPPP